RTTRAPSPAGKRSPISLWPGPRRTSGAPTLPASPPEETVMTTQSTRRIAGVSVPDSPLIADAIKHAQELSEPYLFNHAMRSWLFAAKIGQVKKMDCDHEVVAVGTILHDIGLTPGVGGENRFEADGANAARSFIEERGVSDRRAQLVW